MRASKTGPTSSGLGADGNATKARSTVSVRPVAKRTLINERTIALIEAAGAEVRFLPAYSPDLNPIEMMWSKVKAFLRKAQARNHPDLLVAIASALNAVTPHDALGWFAACGYNFI